MPLSHGPMHGPLQSNLCLTQLIRPARSSLRSVLPTQTYTVQSRLNIMNGHTTAIPMALDQVQHPTDVDTDTDTGDATSSMSRTIRDLRGGIVVLPEDEPMFVCLDCGTQIALQVRKVARKEYRKTICN